MLRWCEYHIFFTGDFASEILNLEEVSILKLNLVFFVKCVAWKFLICASEINLLYLFQEMYET